MLKVRALAEAVAPVTSKVTKEKEKYSKGFVAASDAVVDRVKGKFFIKIFLILILTAKYKLQPLIITIRTL